MPFLTIKTNGFCNNPSLSEDAAKLVAEILGKPLKVIAVSLEYNQQMAFDGSMQNKGAWIELAAIGFKDKAVIAAALTDFAVNNLNVEKELVCLRLIDLKPVDVAHGGKLLG